MAEPTNNQPPVDTVIPNMRVVKDPTHDNAGMYHPQTTTPPAPTVQPSIMTTPSDQPIYVPPAQERPATSTQQATPQGDTSTKQAEQEQPPSSSVPIEEPVKPYTLTPDNDKDVLDTPNKSEEFDKAVEAFNSSDDDDTNDIKNRNKFTYAFSLGTPEKTVDMLEHEASLHPNDFNAVQNDVSSNYWTIAHSLQHITENFSLLRKSLEDFKDDLTKKLVPSIQGLVDKTQMFYKKYKEQSEITLSGSEGYLAMTLLSDNLRQFKLYASGIYLNLKNLTLNDLRQFYNEVSNNRYEYGKALGKFYYHYQSLDIQKYVIEKLLPVAITGSDYRPWRNMEKLQQTILFQDFDVILWALATMMYPSGITMSWCCPECNHITSAKSDLSKMRLFNSDIVNEDMIKYFRKTGWREEEDIENFHKLCNFEKTINFEYESSPGKMKKWEVVLKQATLYDFVQVGNEFNAELLNQCDPKRINDVTNYYFYNEIQIYRPWIKSIALKVVNDEGKEQKYIVENDGTPENTDTIKMLLDDFRSNYHEISKLIQEYIISTRLTHICFYLPKCPHCGAPTQSSVNGYIPYDPLHSFFTLTLMRLMRDTTPVE